MMEAYPHISHALYAIYDSGMALLEYKPGTMLPSHNDAAIRMYKRSALQSNSIEALKSELQSAFTNHEISWKTVLSEEFDVHGAETEEEAKNFAKIILWNPIFEDQP